MPKGEPIQHRLSNYGALGYGINIIDFQPKALIAEFTFQDPAQIFKWRDKRIAIPDQITWDPSPHGNEDRANFSSSIKTAREFQSNLIVSAGLSGTDPETDLSFSGKAEDINKLFSQTSSEHALDVYEADYDYWFLHLKNIHLKKCVRPDVNLAAQSCGHDEEKIRGFFDTFGTHVVNQGYIGGRLHIRKTLRVDAESAKTISQQKIDIKGQVSGENNAYIHGRLNLDERDENTNETYRKVSTNTHNVMGGNMSALYVDEWHSTLRDSDIPTQDVSPLSKRVTSGPGLVGLIGGSENQYLALTNCQYIEIFHVLDISEHHRHRFDSVLKDYLRGKNPFNHDVQRLAPNMARKSSDDGGISIVKIKYDEKAVHKMIGWMATYETYAGLEAKPGAHAIVRCRSDAELSIWTEKTIYSGERIMLRGKTPYLSAYMWVVFAESLGDDDARLWTENRLVAW